MIATTVRRHEGANVPHPPVRFRPAESDDPPVTDMRPPGVLVVDDDQAVLTLLNIVLRQKGLAVWLTSNGHDALRVYQGHRNDIDLVLLDVHMPGLDGPQTV